MEEDNHKLQWQYVRTQSQKHQGEGKEESESRGIAFGDKAYHIFDFVLYRAEKGLSHSGGFCYPKAWESDVYGFESAKGWEGLGFVRSWEGRRQ
jgi:hypothetical protein